MSLLAKNDMPCIFCKHNLGKGNQYLGFIKIYYCNNCPIQVNQYFDHQNSPEGKLVMYGFLINGYSYPRYLINVTIEPKTLEILEVKQPHLDDYTEDDFRTSSVFIMDDPPLLNPQTAPEFLKRILKQKVFL